MAQPLREVGERAAIASVIQILGPRGKEAAKGDDAAVVRVPAREGRDAVATTDTITYALHRMPGAPLRLFGYYACAVTVSDLAAMGATPRGMLIAVGLPPDTAFGDLKDLALGFREAADTLHFDVWGGDLKQAPTEHITTTGIGDVPRGRALRRSGSKPGWTVGVTGFLGRAAMGATLAASGDALGYELLYRFVPRVEAGERIAAVAKGVVAMDSSDGLSSSLDLLCRATPGIGMEVEWDRLPLHPGLRKAVGLDRVAEVALHWGGDYELVVAAPPRTFSRLRDSLSTLRSPLTPIGRVTAQPGLTLVRNGKREPLPVRGFEHFKTAPGAAP